MAAYGMAANQPNAAVKKLKTIATINPDYYPLTLQYADTLIAADIQLKPVNYCVTKWFIIQTIQ